MGRRKLWHEEIHARFKAGTIGRIDEVLDPLETRLDFVRSAVRRELRRRMRERERQDEDMTDAEWQAMTKAEQDAWYARRFPPVAPEPRRQLQAELKALLEAEERLKQSRAAARALKKAQDAQVRRPAV